jgi:hypothetical protein
MFLSEIKILPTTTKKYKIQNNIKIKSLMNLTDLLEKYKIVYNETYKLIIYQSLFYYPAQHAKEHFLV